MISVQSRKTKWFLALLVVGALALALIGGGRALAQSRHDAQHEISMTETASLGPAHHDVQQERPHGQTH